MKYSITILLFLSACGGSADTAPAQDEATAGPHPLEDRHLSVAPEGAVEVSELRSLGDGASVVLRGDVADFSRVEGKAVLTVFDHSLLSCDEMGEEDHCATPWDFCCEDADKITLGSTTVEFREEGRLVSASLEGLHGLDYLSDVVVEGTLSIDEVGNTRVIAAGIHVE